MRFGGYLPNLAYGAPFPDSVPFPKCSPFRSFPAYYTGKAGRFGALPRQCSQAPTARSIRHFPRKSGRNRIAGSPTQPALSVPGQARPPASARHRTAFRLQPGGNVHDATAQRTGVAADELRASAALAQARFIDRVRDAFSAVRAEHRMGQHPADAVLRYPVLVPAPSAGTIFRHGGAHCPALSSSTVTDIGASSAVRALPSTR